MPESGRPAPHVDPARLSAYCDGGLDRAERTRVEEHLRACPACRAIFDGYGLVSQALRADEDVPPPVGLDRRVAALVEERSAVSSRQSAVGRRTADRRVPTASLGPRTADRRPPTADRRLPTAWAAMLAAGVLAGLLLFGLPFGDGTGGPAVAAAYPCADPAECAVAVRFAGAVDRAGVERSLRIEPPVAVRMTWQGDTLLVQPTEPLQPATGYTLSLQPRGADAGATPVALHFVAGGAASPVALATRHAPAAPAAATGAASPPPPTPAPRAAAPTPQVTAAEAPRPAPTATPCPVQPIRGFGTLYQSRPAVAARLGCAGAPERGVHLVAQPFQGGRLLWRADRREILALLDGGRWQSYPDTFDGRETATPAAGEPIRGFGKLWREQPDLRAALGAATAPEQPIGAAVEEFAHGLLLWTADRTIYALYADGTFERFADTYAAQEPPAASPSPAVPPTARTPAAALAPTTAASGASVPATPPVAGPTAAPTPGPPPTMTAALGTPTGCSIYPVRGFGARYAGSPAVAARLGCARGPEVGVQLARQAFERGVLIWRADTREIVVLQTGGRGAATWSAYPDTWREGETLADVGAAPAGLLAPERGFGKLWRGQPEVRQALGWATAGEEPLPGAVQEFAGGRMLWTGDRLIFVLSPDGTWTSFADASAN